jgi:hypothetical protein
MVLTTALLAGCGSPPVRTTPPPPAAESLPPPVPAAPPVKTDAQRQAEFDRSMDRWHGAKLKELVSKLGPPNTRTRLRSGEWIYTYARSSTVRGPSGPERFSCEVNYRVDARTETIVGHRIKGC